MISQYMKNSCSEINPNFFDMSGSAPKYAQNSTKGGDVIDH